MITPEFQFDWIKNCGVFAVLQYDCIPFCITPEMITPEFQFDWIKNCGVFAITI